MRAGRPPTGEKAGLRHARRDRFRKLPAHVTLRLRPGLPSLRSVALVREIERTFACGCARRDFRLIQYSRQQKHAHLVVEADDRGALGRGMMAIGARLARAVNRVAKRSGPVLADRYHSRLLSTPREVHRALRYVLLNARRHAAKALALTRLDAVLDPACSARWFDGWKPRAHPVTGHGRETRPAPPPVARARTRQ